MEPVITSSNFPNSWEIVPASTLAGVILAILFVYLFFRHILFVLMFADLILGWLRRFDWFPRKGKRLKTFVHWLVALGLFLGFVAVAGSVGWLKFVPEKSAFVTAPGVPTLGSQRAFSAVAGRGTGEELCWAGATCARLGRMAAVRTKRPGSNCLQMAGNGGRRHRPA